MRVLLVLLTLASPALAQVPTPPGQATDSKMGLPQGSGPAPSNGVGTEGSLDRNAGKASSTVAGVHGGTSSFGASDGGHAKPAESQPSIGGEEQKPK